MASHFGHPNGFPKKVFLRNYWENPDTSFYYFSKISENLEGSILLERGKKPVVLSSFLEQGLLEKYGNFSIKSFQKREERLDFLKKEIVGKIGLNFATISKKDFDFYKKTFPKAKFFDISGKLGKLMQVKTSKEVKKISKAAKISQKTIENLHSLFKKGMTEKQLALRLEFALRENGGQENAFPSIVAFGKNSAIPHYIPGNKKIGKGLLLIDFGAKFENYCSDLSRTFFAGKAGKTEKNLYETVFSAKILSQKMVKSGVKAVEVFNEANAFLKKNAGQELLHGLGHGLGLKVHDFPNGFTRNSKDILKDGMVLTIEPGVYKSFGGIRIEDDVVVGKNSCRLLSKAPNELIELK